MIEEEGNVMPKINALEFALRAQRSQGLWKLLTGRSVEHVQFGKGEVTNVVIDAEGNVTITIRFQYEERRFEPFVCKDLGDIEFPEEIHAQFTQSTAQTNPPEPKFKANDDVSVVNNPSQRGRISGAYSDHNGEWNYEVYITAEARPTFKEADLKLHVPITRWGSLNDLLRDLAVAKMKQPMSDALYALYASRTKFEVYQFKPALKFLSNPDQRLLIADEVGLGKTIEAGIIYLELQARLGLDQVLFVCPSSLKYKWQSEMKSRFDEDFIILEKDRLQDFILRSNNYPRGIISLESIRRREVAEKFRDIKFDLVVIDEAHHCRNTATLANAIASTLIENSDAALLLTATPLQMGRADLFNLLRILSPGEFDNSHAFEKRLEPNQFVNEAAEYLAHGMAKNALDILKGVEHTSERERFLGNPQYRAIVKILENDHPSRQDLVTAQRKLLELNTLASIFTRTRKRDVQENAPKRTAQTLKVNFTPEEKQFYNDVIDEVRTNFLMRSWSGRGSGWVTIMKERQAASSISALMKKMRKTSQQWNYEEEAFLTEFANIQLGGSSDDWVDDFGSPSESSVFNRRSWSSVSGHKQITDSKFEVFWGALKKVLDDDPKSKVLVFSFFVGTIEHVGDELKKRGVNARTIHGGIAVTNRQKIIEEFRDDPSIRVLVSSDVGSEGLDFQFCDTLFNYDLPWNPMKVEQRIGRVDRFGQQSERIRIYNLVIEDSIEERILLRLYDRIEIFKQSIGDIEVILGEQIRELTNAVFSNRLTPEEEIQRAEEAVNVVLRQKQDLEEFEEQRMQFLGQEAILSTAVHNTIESGRFISSAEVQSLVSEYIRENFKLSRLGEKDSEDDTYTLIVNEDLAREIKAFIYEHKKGDRTALQFVEKLIPGKEIPITFSHELAYQRKLLEFITPRHPLARAAFEFWTKKNTDSITIYHSSVQTNIAPSGRYFFFVFSLNSKGVDTNVRLIPVVISEETLDKNNILSEQFLRLAQTSGTTEKSVGGKPDKNVLDEILPLAIQHMTVVRDRIDSELRETNESIVNARLAAVNQSHQAKQRHIQGILDKVRDASIRRMYEGQLRNMDAKKMAKENEIEKGRLLNVNFELQLRGFIDVVNHK